VTPGSERGRAVRIPISEGDTSSARPYENLSPIVDALAAAGNSAIEGGFVLNQAGWACRMAKPIDFVLVREQFELPPSIDVAAEQDTILDRSTWVAIEGPLSRARGS
jgi:hypothetical protein